MNGSEGVEVQLHGSGVTGSIWSLGGDACSLMHMCFFQALQSLPSPYPTSKRHANWLCVSNRSVNWCIRLHISSNFYVIFCL